MADILPLAGACLGHRVTADAQTRADSPQNLQMPDLSHPISPPGQPPRPGAGLSDQDVRHVARLARLAIPEPMVHTYALQLQGILEYVAKIAQVDIEGIAPTAHAIQMQNVFREDVVGPMLSLDQVLGNAPDTDPPFFKVPKVIGAEEDSAG